MAIAYSSIARAVALRANQLADAPDAATFDRQFKGDLKANLGGLEVPFAALKLAILASEKRFAEMIGFSRHQLYRAGLYGKSIAVADQDLIPTADENGKPFIGSFSGVFDAKDNQSLTQEPNGFVKRVRRNLGGFYLLEQYFYCFTGNRILHTRQEVYFEGCVWSESEQSKLFDEDKSSPLPQSFENLWIADVLGNLPQENWFVTESQVYRSIVADAEKNIKENLEVGVIVLPN